MIARDDMPPEELDRLADELHAAGLARTDKARRTFRDSFPDDEAFRAHMRRIGDKARVAKLRAAVARRRAKAAARRASGIAHPREEAS